MAYAHPFNYYYSKLLEGNCPFCNEPLEYTFEGCDVIYCDALRGYLSLYEDALFAGGHDPCNNCERIDPNDADFNQARVGETSPVRHLVQGNGFICEQCNHGVDLEKLIAFQLVFRKHDFSNCRHCSWHDKRSPENMMHIPIL